MNKHSGFITCLIALCYSFAKAQEWSYTPPTGPADWSNISPDYVECGVGRSQSPVNIATENTVQNEGSGLLFFNNDQPRTGTLSNNGHFIEFEADFIGSGASDMSPLVTIVHEENDPFFAGRELGEHYVLCQIHFHWGESGSLGAEHYINNAGGLGEVHIIYFNNKYENFSNAENKSDGLTILAFRLDTCPGSAFSGLFGSNNQFLNMIRLNSTTRVSGIPWKFADIYTCENEFPFCMERFYVYHGSLTTPPCLQSVLWWVSDQRLCITDDQLEMLRMQRVSENGPFLSNNYRPLQDLNGRTIIRIGNTTTAEPSISNVMMILVSLLVLIQIIFL